MGLRALARRVPGARRVYRRLVPYSPPWPPVRAPLMAPACPPGWLSGPPDFVGIGAQRAGTSWLYSLIDQHPEVHANEGVPKEIHYFDKYFSDAWSSRDAADYARLFPRPPGTITGEWTPEYMLWPWCAPLLADSGVTKLVVSLRDPVERYRAGWAFSVRRGAPPAGTIAGDAYFRGLYHQQLQAVLHHFERSQLLVLQYEACLVDPVGEVRRAYEFLGVDPSFEPVDPAGLVKARHPKAEIDPRLRETLIQAYRPDVVALVSAFPTIDLSLWPNFATGPLG